MWLEFALIVVIIVILVARSNKERFDVYNNHPMGAQTVYSTTGVPSTGEIEDLSMRDAGQLARYTWREADPKGLNVYDHYYENVVAARVYDSDAAPGYDSKFTVMSPSSGYVNYGLEGMLDPDPLYTTFNGEYIVLSQKNH